MIRFNPALAIGLVSLLALTACADATKTVSDTADQAKEATEQAAGAATDTAKQAGEAVTDTAGQAVDAAADTAKQAGEAVADTAETATDAVTDTAETAADAVTDTAETTADAVTGTADQATGGVSGIPDLAALKEQVTSMKEGASQTLDSVKSGDFAAAKDQFGELQQSWYKFGGSLKSLPGEGGYQKIDEGMKAVKSALNQDNPDQNQLSGQLEGVVDLLGKVPLG